jgi:hypothetical protein
MLSLIAAGGGLVVALTILGIALAIGAIVFLIRMK